jgi:twitching motility protein PilT
MNTMESILAKHIREGTISFEAGVAKSSRPDELQRLIGATPMVAANGRN